MPLLGILCGMLVLAFKHVNFRTAAIAPDSSCFPLSVRVCDLCYASLKYGFSYAFSYACTSRRQPLNLAAETEAEQQQWVAAIDRVLVARRQSNSPDDVVSQCGHVVCGMQCVVRCQCVLSLGGGCSCLGFIVCACW